MLVGLLSKTYLVCTCSACVTVRSHAYNTYILVPDVRADAILKCVCYEGIIIKHARRVTSCNNSAANINGCYMTGENPVF